MTIRDPHCQARASPPLDVSQGNVPTEIRLSTGIVGHERDTLDTMTPAGCIPYTHFRGEVCEGGDAFASEKGGEVLLLVGPAQ